MIAASAARCASLSRGCCPGLAVNQAVRPLRVEPYHPVANDLKRHPANLRRLGTARPPVNRRQEAAVVAFARRPSIASPPPAAPLRHNLPEDQPPPPWRTSSCSPWSNQIPPDSGIPPVSRPQRGRVLLETSTRT